MTLNKNSVTFNKTIRKIIMNFRKRIKLFGFLTFNFSKTGVSTTVGVPGASVNIGKNGTFLNTGLPGTGLYDRKKIGANNSNQEIKDDIEFKLNFLESVLPTDIAKKYEIPDIRKALPTMVDIKSLRITKSHIDPIYSMYNVKFTEYIYPSDIKEKLDTMKSIYTLDFQFDRIERIEMDELNFFNKINGVGITVEMRKIMIENHIEYINDIYELAKEWREYHPLIPKYEISIDLKNKLEFLQNLYSKNISTMEILNNAEKWFTIDINDRKSHMGDIEYISSTSEAYNEIIDSLRKEVFDSILSQYRNEAKINNLPELSTHLDKIELLCSDKTHEVSHITIINLVNEISTMFPQYKK